MYYVNTKLHKINTIFTQRNTLSKYTLNCKPVESFSFGRFSAMKQIEVFWGNESLRTLASRLVLDSASQASDKENHPRGGELLLDWGKRDLETIASGLVVDKETKTKSDLAVWILTIFAATLLVLIGGGELTIALRPPAESEQALRNFAPYLQAVESFASKIFGPLLGFILGYYFASNRSARDSK
jgi:hypothetical protein